MSKQRLIEKLPAKGGFWRWGSSVLVALVALTALEGWARQQNRVIYQPPARNMGVVRLAASGQVRERAAPSVAQSMAPPAALRAPPQTVPAGEASRPGLSQAAQTLDGPTKSTDPVPPQATIPRPARPQLAPGRPAEPPLSSSGAALSSPASSPTPSPSALASARLVSPQQLDAGFRRVAGGRPLYPVGARRAGISGEVRVELEIAPSGQVARVSIVREPAGWGFGDAARRAYLAARFTPPTVAGRPVRVRWLQTLRFSP